MRISATLCVGRERRLRAAPKVGTGVAVLLVAFNMRLRLTKEAGHVRLLFCRAEATGEVLARSGTEPVHESIVRLRGCWRGLRCARIVGRGAAARREEDGSV